MYYFIFHKIRNFNPMCSVKLDMIYLTLFLFQTVNEHASIRDRIEFLNEASVMK